MLVEILKDNLIPVEEVETVANLRLKTHVLCVLLLQAKDNKEFCILLQKVKSYEISVTPEVAVTYPKLKTYKSLFEDTYFTCHRHLYHHHHSCNFTSIKVSMTDIRINMKNNSYSKMTQENIPLV